MTRVTRWLALVALVALCAAPAWSQGSDIPLAVGPPPPVPSMGAMAVNPVTNVSPQTLYYWVIARYPSGAAIPTGPAKVTSTPTGSLSAGHYIEIDWVGISGVSGYDVVRNTSPVYPGTCTACAVTILTTALTVNDTGAALAAYPPAGWVNAGGVGANIGLNNQSSAWPYLAVNIGSLKGKMGVLSGTYTAGDCVAINADGTLASYGGTCGSVAGGTAGYITFFGAGGTSLTYDSTAGRGLFWDSIGHNLCLGALPTSAQPCNTPLYIRSTIADAMTLSSVGGSGNLDILFTSGAGVVQLARVGAVAGSGHFWLNSYATIHFGVASGSAVFAANDKFNISATAVTALVPFNATKVGTNTTTPQEAVDADATIMSRTGALSLLGGTEPTCLVATDLVVDGANNLKVTSASHNFVAGDLTSRLQITAGAGWTAGTYFIVSAAANAAILSSSPAAVGATGGTWNLNRSLYQTTEGGASTADTFRVCSQAADNTMAWRSVGGTGGGGVSSIVGTYTTVAGTSCAAGNNGQAAIITSGYYQSAFCNGSAWSFYRGGLQTSPINDGAFTWNDQGGWSTTNAQGAVVMTQANESYTNRIKYAALPLATAYTATLAMTFNGLYVNSSSSLCGLFIYDSISGAMLNVGLQNINTQGSMAYNKLTNYTTFSASGGQLVSPYMSNLMYVRISDTLTTRTLSWSFDGVSYLTLLSEPSVTFLTANQYGYGGYNATGQVEACTFVSLSLTTP